MKVLIEPTESVMAILFRARQVRQHLAFLVEEAIGIELESIVSKCRMIVIHLPDVGNDSSPFGDEVALVIVVLGGFVGASRRCQPDCEPRKAPGVRQLTLPRESADAIELLP